MYNLVQSYIENLQMCESAKVLPQSIDELLYLLRLAIGSSIWSVF